MPKTTTPYGAWRSPITADRLAAGSIRLGQLEMQGDDVLWIEGRPAESGRSVLVRCDASGATRDLIAPPYSARTRVHEYGGGAYLVTGETVVFSNDEDQRLYRLDPGAEPRPITPEPAGTRTRRYADARATADGRFLVAVRENHERGDEPVNTVVALPVDGSAEPTVLAAGRTFYSNPRPSPDGRRLAWLCWDHPRMPWDGTELWVAELGDDLTLLNARCVAGGLEESIFQPDWSPDGRLHFVSDRSGWWNLYALQEGEALPLCPMEAEWGGPAWIFGLEMYAFLDDGRIACTVSRKGRETLGILEPGAAEPTWLDLPYTSYQGSLRTNGARLAFLAASPTAVNAAVSCDLDGGDVRVLRRSLDVEIDPSWFPVPEAIEFPSGGRVAHALYYPPTSPEEQAPEDERPPLLVLSHGGPTAHTLCALDLASAYWTSRGFAVVRVNYGGSTGYGRAYRMRLEGRWGVVDVEDCAAAARWLGEQGLADPDRLAIRGGSAGGYTTLCALAFHDVFAAGASYYGVADLEALARDTHKFESRYLDGLIGPYPEARDLYRERSPIHAADGLSCPVIFFQGLEDPVVPPEQTRIMVQALRKKGVPTACFEFEGEQHGFRREESIRRSTEAELSFYGRVFGFEPADETEPLELS
jgi:dipeptidyl aminopeptidase/acylaminoacyl peptidase